VGHFIITAENLLLSLSVKNCENKPATWCIIVSANLYALHENKYIFVIFVMNCKVHYFTEQVCTSVVFQYLQFHIDKQLNMHNTYCYLLL